MNYISADPLGQGVIRRVSSVLPFCGPGLVEIGCSPWPEFPLMRGGGAVAGSSVTHHRLDVSCAFFYHVSWVFERTLFAARVFDCFFCQF